VIQDLVAGAQKALSELRSAKDGAAATEKAQAEVIDELKEEIRLTTSLSSLGIMAASFGHERVKDAVLIRNNIGLLKMLRANPHAGLFTEQDEADALRFLEEGAARIEAFAKFALDHVLPGKRRGMESEIVDVIQKTFRMFQPTTDTMNVKALLKLPDYAVTVPGWQAGWESVIANLLINSLYFLRGRKAEDRIIHISLSALDGSNACLQFEDNGKGLEAGTETDIFRPGFSTRRDEDGDQEGTGLGLTLVKSFISSIGGTIVAKKSPKLDGAAFEITVPTKQLSGDYV
jgi:C4-dicarboxylate-specific signal transduction histidine kinase